MVNMRLKGNVVIVTGAGGGIGSATVKLFLAEGAKVVAADWNEVVLEQLANNLQHQANLICMTVDVSKRESVQQLIRQTCEAFGKVDVLINNAGITNDAMLKNMTTEQFESVIQVNLTGVFNCTQEAATHMVGQGHGKIINTTSVSGVYGNVGQTNYAAAKAGVIGMTKTWAKELGRKNINVNAVAPGFIETPMVKKMPDHIITRMESTIPLGRLGQPEDIAKAYLFLASDDANYINGHVLHVDGAIMM